MPERKRNSTTDDDSPVGGPQTIAANGDFVDWKKWALHTVDGRNPEITS